MGKSFVEVIILVIKYWFALFTKRVFCSHRFNVTVNAYDNLQLDTNASSHRGFQQVQRSRHCTLLNGILNRCECKIAIYDSICLQNSSIVIGKLFSREILCWIIIMFLLYLTGFHTYTNMFFSYSLVDLHCF